MEFYIRKTPVIFFDELQNQLQILFMKFFNPVLMDPSLLEHASDRVLCPLPPPFLNW